MSTDILLKIARKWFAAFNAHDIDSLLALYHDDAVHYSPKLKMRRPETNGLIEGKAALRAWWTDSFERLPTLTYEIIKLTPYEDRIFMEYVRRVMGQDNLNVGEVLDLQGELIIASRVYHG
jgi:hypothetical protein